MSRTHAWMMIVCVICTVSTAVALQPLDTPYDRAMREGKEAFAAKRFDVAAKRFQGAAAIAKEKDEASQIYAAALDHLGAAHAQLGQYREAEHALTQARDIIVQLNDRFHPDLLATLQNLGLVHRATKQFDKAIENSRWMLKIAEAHFGKEHLSVAAVLSNLAAIEQQRGRHDKAEAHLTNALRIREKRLEPDDPVLSQTYRDMGNTTLAQKKFKDAETWFNKMLAAVEKRAPDSLAHAQALQDKSKLYEFTRDFKKALPLIEKAHSIRGLKQGFDHVAVGQTAYTLSRLHLLTRDFKSAEAFSRLAISIFRKKLGETHPFHMVALLNHTTILEATGRRVEAAQYKKKIEELKKQSATKTTP